jgi:hypothetical protein
MEKYVVGLGGGSVEGGCLPNMCEAWDSTFSTIGGSQGSRRKKGKKTEARTFGCTSVRVIPWWNLNYR